MPELPEVETVVRGLAKSVVGDVVRSVWLSEASNWLKSAPEAVTAAVEGARIVAVRRMGKHIVMDLAAPLASVDGVRGQWVVHLGMTGRLLVTAPDEHIAKHTHCIAQLESGRELRFVDPRRFGKMWVHSSEAGFATGGVEPLEITLDAFVALFRCRKTHIKSALLNQKLLRGVGNIYADESLFRAGVRPRRRAATLTRDELRRLYESVREVLREAIAAGGSSINNYVDTSGEPGFFQIQHRVYGRTGEPCVVCGTPIKRIVVGGRGTHYCPRCQR